MTRHLEIEIFVRDCPIEQALDWARSNVGELIGPYDGGDSIVYRLSTGEGAVVLKPNIENGPFTSVWFNTPSSPWTTDVECARSAVAALDRVVRCDPGESDHEQDPFSDSFLEFDGESERVVSWTDSDA